MQEYLLRCRKNDINEEVIRVLAFVCVRNIYLLDGQTGSLGSSQLRKRSCRVCD